ncbi:hypothetical protein BJX64DRAFT_285378 [Aspergillus heterothallicus]
MGVRQVSNRKAIAPLAAWVELRIPVLLHYRPLQSWQIALRKQGTLAYLDPQFDGQVTAANGGSAALNEVVRGFGLAVKKGWKPRRTIVFASWDGHEAAVLGVSASVERHLSWLSNATVAYLEVEIAATGTELLVKSSPLLETDVTARVPSPNQTIPGQSVRDVWHGKLATEAGSDLTPFVSTAIQPGGIIPFNVTAYATALEGYVQIIREAIENSKRSPVPLPSSCSLNLDPLNKAISHLLKSATALDADGQDPVVELHSLKPEYRHADLEANIDRVNTR